MRRLRNIPIQRKLRVVILGTCSAALVVACGALFGLQFYFFKRDFERELSALSAIVGSGSRQVLKDGNRARAAEILDSLHAKPRITGATLLSANGKVLAQSGDGSLLYPRGTTLKEGLQSLDDEWFYASTVYLDQQPIGTLILHPDYKSHTRELFRVYAAILVAVLAISFLVAALISWRLERLILFPIQNLASTARNISRRNDYSIRAQKFVDDELGTFTDSFNGMLEQIEIRDRALRHEIAERKRAEEELQRMQEQLISASRRAGMAEVATGVLHNVGNVLNSVNVSATLISEKLTHSRIENLSRAVTLIETNKDGLAQFFSADPKGKILPTYISDVAETLTRERHETLAELELLNKNIEHIKDIVARQQSYARCSGIVEPLDLEELIEDAIRMNADSFDRHGVILCRKYERIGPAIVDRHKVLEIMINVLRNAKHAMADTPADQKHLSIRLESRGDTAVIRVTDSGVGIAPENLTKIFSHGFTTRTEGHGFGLHSAAVAAQQMGGHLAAESAGTGSGATFILEVPLAKEAPPTAILIPAVA